MRRVRSCQRGAAAAKILICYYLSQVSSEFWCRIPRTFFGEREGYIWTIVTFIHGPSVCQKPAANRQKEALARLASLIDCTAAKEPSEELGQKCPVEGRKNRTIFKGAQLGCQNFATK